METQRELTGIQLHFHGVWKCLEGKHVELWEMDGNGSKQVIFPQRRDEHPAVPATVFWRSEQEGRRIFIHTHYQMYSTFDILIR